MTSGDGSGPSTCMVLLAGIGDVVHGLPVAEGIRRAEPEGRITWVAQPAPSRVLLHNPSVDRVVVFRRGRGLGALAPLLRAMGRERHDRCLNLQRYLKSVLPVLLSRAPVRVGLPPSKTREGVSLFHNQHLPEGPWVHVQELFLRFLDVLGIARPDPLRWPIPLSEEEVRARAELFGPLGTRPVAGLVLGSAIPAKNWPAGRYAELADALASDFGYRVVLLGGPGELEREAARVVRERTSAPVVDALQDSVRSLIWKISGCDLVVSPDTGGLHLAHALEVPVVGLFGLTNPWRTGPFLRYHDLVIDRYTDPDETPGPEGYEPRQGRMERIGVDDVLERVERARARYGAGRRKALEGVA